MAHASSEWYPNLNYPLSFLSNFLQTSWRFALPMTDGPRGWSIGFYRIVITQLESRTRGAQYDRLAGRELSRALVSRSFSWVLQRRVCEGGTPVDKPALFGYRMLWLAVTSHHRRCRRRVGVWNVTVPASWLAMCRQVLLDGRTSQSKYWYSREVSIVAGQSSATEMNSRWCCYVAGSITLVVRKYDKFEMTKCDNNCLVTD